MVSRELPPHGGGIGSYTDKTARQLATLGHDVHVVSEAWDASPSVEVDHGVTIHRLARPRVRPYVLGRAWVVARALRRLGDVDLVQACEWGGEASLYAVRRDRPLLTRLATPHFIVEGINGLSRRQRMRTVVSRLLERVQARRSDALISPSAALADAVSRAWRIPRQRIAVVPTGISLPDVTSGASGQTSSRLREALPATGDGGDLALYILYFGRLETRKGVDVWIDALPAVLRALPAIHAVFIGHDVGAHGRPFAEIAVERCGTLAARVHFLPHLPHAELLPIVAGARLVVMPSRWENLANTCLEAMALGRPVLACTGSGFDEVITSGVDGYLVPPGESAPLAAAAIAALSDEERLTDVAAAARRRAADFDLGLMVGRLVEVQQALIGARAVSAVRVAP